LHREITIHGDKKMKECVECQKKLGIIEGYRHPTRGKNYLLCSKCFDTVFESVEKYREFITPYIGFFNKKSSTTNRFKHMHGRMSNLWSNKTNQIC
jgi:NAD-dependent SIR2 family protein deacetylase